MAAGVNQTTQELRGTLQSQVSDTLDMFRKHRESLQEELRLSFDRLSGESIGMHAERLETASDSWMLRSVRQLNEHGRTGDRLAGQVERDGGAQFNSDDIRRDGPDAA